MELLNSLGLTVVAFVFVLGVLIFIHELGHCLVAKFLGIRVDVFSLGFGTRLFGFKRGDTDYRVSLIPLGGYVKMAGENPDEELSGSPEEFLSRPKLHRFAVAVAGPVMNIGLAVLLLAANFMAGTQTLAYLDEPAVIGAVEFDSPAARAGLQIGDRIAAVDGEATPTWKDLEFKIASSPEIALKLTIERNGQTLQRTIIAETSEDIGAGFIGVHPFVRYVVEKVEEGSPAEQAGISAGDEIVSVEHEGQSYSGFWMIAEVVHEAGIVPLDFVLRRDGQRIEKTIVPVLKDDQPRMGAYLALDTRIEEYTVGQALSRSLRENWRMTALTFTTVGRLITGRASMKQMSGPIEIARFSGIAASQGWVALLSFMAIVSLQLGILNLLPIPILDGGVITLLAVEGLLGRDLSLRVKELIFKLGFIFIVVLMGVVIVNDITKNLPDF